MSSYMIRRAFDVVGLNQGPWDSTAVHKALDDLLMRDLGIDGVGVDILLDDDDVFGAEDERQNAGQNEDGNEESESEEDDASLDGEQAEDST